MNHIFVIFFVEITFVAVVVAFVVVVAVVILMVAHNGNLRVFKEFGLKSRLPSWKI